MNGLKLCIKCKHFKPQSDSTNFKDRCSRPVVSYVDGSTRTRGYTISAYGERHGYSYLDKHMDEDRCGREGRFFEENNNNNENKQDRVFTRKKKNSIRL